ncbi:MAG: NUDIX domain-containing protein [bacterium]|nr:NUDIX domain-containing protein [bacterium]
MEERKVVTCFLEYDSKILILRRSKKVSTYRKRWAGVSGYIEKEADTQALIEIEEETKLRKEDVELIRKGGPLEIIDKEKGIKWWVHPYLFHVKDPGKIEIDWEHTETKWIKPTTINRFKTVPKLKETLDRVWKDDG